MKTMKNMASDMYNKLLIALQRHATRHNSTIVASWLSRWRHRTD